MFYALLFVGAVGSPTLLGTFDSLESCQNSIRNIYTQKLTPRGVDLTDQMLETIKASVDIKLKYQREYVCDRRNQK